MSSYGSFEKVLSNPGQNYVNNCKDGQCSNCGECCTDLLPLTIGELNRIKSYVKKHHLKENRHNIFWDKKAIDLTCPFRNSKNSKCDIYNIRPAICREFICSKSIEKAHEDRDRILSQDRNNYSLRYEVFGNPETVFLINGVLNKIFR